MYVHHDELKDNERSVSVARAGDGHKVLAAVFTSTTLHSEIKSAIICLTSFKCSYSYHIAIWNGP